MARISMKHLRYFEALARHKHFGHAANACSISQPALSVQIRDLEALIGAPLVERQPRSIRLTGLGEEFATRVSGILRSVDDLEDLARAARKTLVGPLRLGIIPTVAPYLLPAILNAVATHHPDLDTRPREAVTRKLIQELLDARLDAAIVALPVSEPLLTEVALFEEEFLFLRHADDAAKPVPDPQMLREMRLLLLEEGHCFRDQALSYCKIAQGSARELMEASSLSTLVQMVGAGIGVTLIPEMAISVETRSASVSVNRMPPPYPTRTLGMVWRKTNPLFTQLQTIAEFIRETTQGGP